MRIDRVRLTNFCQHTQRDDLLGAGVIGIVGRNGSGKSNYLRAIRRAFTGESGNPGKKEEDVRWESEKGSVQVDFTAGTVSGFIKRDLKSARCTMQFGDKGFKTATEVDQIIYQILGYNPRIMSDIVFVEQGQIEGILFQKPSERAKSLQSLFGTEPAEKIREYLQADIVNTVVETRAPVIDKLKVQLATEVTQPLDEIDRLVPQIHARMLGDDKRATFAATLLRRETQIKASATTAQMKAQINSYQTELVKTEASYKDVESKHAALKTTIVDCEPLIAVSNHVLELNKKIMADLERKASLESEVKRYSDELAVPEPKPPANCANLKEMQDRVAALDVQRAMCLKVTKVDANTCPTCNQPIAQALKDYYQNLLSSCNAELFQLTPVATSLAAAVRQYEYDHTTWRANYANSRKNLANAQSALSRLSIDIPPTSQELTDAEQMIKLHNTSRQTLAELTVTLAVRADQVKSLRVSLANSMTIMSSAEAQLGSPVSDEEAEQVRTALEQHDKAALEMSELRGRLQALEQQRESIVRQITQYESEEQKLGPIKLYRDLLERARQILHRDQLPNLVAQAYLRAINIRIGKYLEMFEASFVASIASDLTVVCSFGGGRQVTAERLSGGERVMLGIAFRFAIYDLFMSQLGLLVLDEPTVYLDDDRVDGIFKLLEKVKSYSKNSGLQLIVVTHEQRLAGVFDQVIHL